MSNFEKLTLLYFANFFFRRVKLCKNYIVLHNLLILLFFENKLKVICHVMYINKKYVDRMRNL